MTTESAVLVRLDDEDASQARGFADRITTARSRAAKALPGDRTEHGRVEAVHRELLRLAHRVRCDDPTAVTELSEPPTQLLLVTGQEELATLGPPADEVAAGWIASGAVAVPVLISQRPGPTRYLPVAEQAPGVADPWDAGDLRGRDAVMARFLNQVDTALASTSDVPPAIVPTNVDNDVLARGLHTVATHTAVRDGLPVAYRDGSEAAHFPVGVADTDPPDPDEVRTLRFALLSIRHVDLDEVVHGAWLRNRQISQRRPMGETDQLAHEISRMQLQRLLADGPLRIEMFQTGLEAAVVGFYRAVAEVLRDHPGRLWVRCRFYSGKSSNRSLEDRYPRGPLWGGRRRA